MKTLQNTMLATLIVGGALLSTGSASAGTDTISDAPPPPSRVEYPPPHRDGYVWAPGYWEWNGRFFKWIYGTWILERRGKHWVADRWDQVEDKWRYVPGHWDR